MRITKRGSLVAGIAAAALILSGCSGSGTTNEVVEGANGPLTPVTFQLNWVAGGANAGFAVAVADGLYEEEGLDVTLVEGNGSGNTAQLVASNQAQIAYADAVSVSQLIAKGAAMRVISTIYQSNPNAVQALKETGLKSIADLKGRTIGVPSGSSQTTMLPLLFEANGLEESDLELVHMPATSMVASLLQGQVDAILGSVDAYAIQLEQQGAEIDQYTFAENGVPTVSTSIFASDRFLVDNPEIAEKIIAASLKGWESALDDPENAIKAVKEVFPDVVADTAAAELAAIPKLFCTGGAKYIGKAEPEQWEETQELLSSVDLLPKGQDPTTYYSNEYLPADSELRACDSDD